jgi:hypothetical protein
MHTPGKSDNHFIGNRFETCPSCGELIGEESQACRFCGYKFDGTPTEIQTQNQIPETPQPEKTSYTEIPAASTKNSPGIKQLPPEYCGNFNEQSFAWPAFWFADLWHADKGNMAKAMRHFIFRSITNGFGIVSIVMFAESASSETSDVAFTLTGMGTALILAFLWCAGVFMNAVLSYMDARVAYWEYCAKCNARPQETENDRKRGITLYWAVLYVPFFVFLIGFIIMLFSIMGAEPSETTGHIDKIQKIHESILWLFY